MAPVRGRGTERVDLQALLSHATLTTTQLDTHVEQDRMAAVGRL
jgi:site-specific recombinase XerD